MASTAIKPEKIRESVKKLPPGQRKEAQQAYAGIDVSWRVLLFNVDKDGNGRMFIVDAGAEGGNLGYPRIHFEIDTKRYPELSVLDEGVVMQVNGRIKRVIQDGLVIELLDNPEIQFVDEKPTGNGEDKHTSGKSVAVINEGKGNTFIGNIFKGFDIGILDRGEDTLAKSNKFFGKQKGSAESVIKRIVVGVIIGVASGLIIGVLTNWFGLAAS